MKCQTIFLDVTIIFWQSLSGELAEKYVDNVKENKLKYAINSSDEAVEVNWNII